MKKRIFVMAVILVIMICCAAASPARAYDCGPVTEISQAECEALVSVYNSTDGDSWSDNGGWLVSDTPCDWCGVECEAGRVTALCLNGNSLTGTLPPDLGNLADLENLDLSSNRLTGAIPPEIGVLTGLRRLSLSSNDLSGTLPAELAALTGLERLLLRGNPDLEGRLPPELMNLEELRFLCFSDTRICEPGNPDFQNWLDSIFSFADPPISYYLRTVICDGGFTCESVTEIPREECEALAALYDSTDGDSWKFRAGWKKTTTPCAKIPASRCWRGVECDDGHVSMIDIPVNNLDGEFPPELADLSHLEFLSLACNHLTGEADLTGLDRLEQIWLCSNDLTGVSGLSTLESLRELRLCGNQLTALPGLGELAGLEYLSLGDNRLDWTLLFELGTLTGLDVLRLGSNSLLAGPLPADLTGLDLSEFSFTGTGLCEPEDPDIQTWLGGIDLLRGTDTGCPANNAPAEITLTGTDINEREPAGTVVGTFETADADAGDTHTYALLSGGETFAVSGNTLVTSAPLYYEIQQNYQIRVGVSDSRGAVLVREFEINVINVNDPPDDIGLDPGSVAEGPAAVNTSAGILSASDPDPGDIHTYTLVPGEGAADNESFEIRGAGLITLTEFDYEARNSFSIRVRATDIKEEFLEKQLTVNISNVNEPPSDIRLRNGTSADVSENRPAGTRLGRLTVRDPDAEDTHAFYLVVSPGGMLDMNYFDIVVENGRAHLTTKAVFNHETRDTYRVYIRCNDSGGRSCFEYFTISVKDVNEPATGLALSSTRTPEGPAGTEVGTFTTSGDPDADETHYYTLVTGEGCDDNNFFRTEGDTLLTRYELDYETMRHSYGIRVRTDDGRRDGMYEETFVILLDDVTYPPTDILLDAGDADERKPTGTPVGTLGSTDPEDPEGTGEYVYELIGTGYPDSAFFSVNGNILETAAVLDLDIKDRHTLGIRTTDKDGSIFEKEFVIYVASHEAPILSSFSAALTPITGKDTENMGDSVAEIIESGPLGLADGSPVRGIAVTSADSRRGAWQYSEDDGAEWRDLGDVSDGNARLLPADDSYRIRFVPDPLTESMITPAVTLRAWDMSTGTAGETADTAEGGGRLAFSANTAEASVRVSATDVSARITGTVRDADGEPLSGVPVSLLSADGSPAGESVTGQDGQYEISGTYLKGHEHTLTAQPGDDSPHADFTESLSFIRDGDIIRDIILTGADEVSVIRGHVRNSDGSMAIPGAQVEAYSATAGFWNRTAAGPDSLWQISDMPAAPDYALRVTADGYLTQKKTGRSPGTSVNFYLEPAGTLTGRVQDADGRGLGGRTAEIRSETSGHITASVTGRLGYYDIPDLPADDIYTVTVYASPHTYLSESGKRTGDTVNFTFADPQHHRGPAHRAQR